MRRDPRDTSDSELTLTQHKDPLGWGGGGKGEIEKGLVVGYMLLAFTGQEMKVKEELGERELTSV